MRLLALELVLLDVEGILQQLLLLLGVNVLETRGDGGAGVAAGVHDVLAVVVLSVVQQSLETGLGEGPGTGVEGLLLSPDDRLRVGVLVEVLLEMLPGEGVKLLNAGDGNVVDLVLGTILVQGSPDLASAENDTINLIGRFDGARVVLGVGNDPLEASVLACEFLNARTGQRVTKQRLGEEDDEGYSTLASAK